MGQYPRITGRKPHLTVIHSPNISLATLESVGLLQWRLRWLQGISNAFQVSVFSCDSIDYTSDIDVKSYPVPFRIRTNYVRHLCYYAWLIHKSKIMTGPILLVGTAVPVISIVKRRSGCPLLVEYDWDYYRQTAKNCRWEPRGVLALPMEAFSVLPADLVLASSQWLARIVHSRYRRRCVVSPLARILLPEVTGHRVKNDSLIMFSGRLHWSKGLDVLLNAMPAVIQRNPKASLMICGTGAELGPLKALVQKNALGGHVAFTGRLNNLEIYQQLEQATVYVQPTLTMEGLPKSVLEAMARKLACIVSDVPGNTELIRHRVTGLIVRRADAMQLACAINELLENAELRSALGEAAQRAAAHYDLNHCLERETRILMAFTNSHRELMTTPGQQ
jgi:glycosyltransferase involved in cell wall biosynthesis